MVNLVSKDNKELLDYLGSHSGRDENKLAAIEAKWGEAVKVNAPTLEDCPVSIECRIVDSIVNGSPHVFVGKVEHVHAVPKLVKENGDMDLKVIEFL